MNIFALRLLLTSDSSKTADLDVELATVFFKCDTLVIKNLL